MEAIVILSFLLFLRNSAIWGVSILVWIFGKFSSLPHLTFYNILFVVYSCWFIKLAITETVNLTSFKAKEESEKKE